MSVCKKERVRKRHTQSMGLTINSDVLEIERVTEREEIQTDREREREGGRQITRQIPNRVKELKKCGTTNPIIHTSTCCYY